MAAGEERLLCVVGSEDGDLLCRGLHASAEDQEGPAPAWLAALRCSTEPSRPLASPAAFDGPMTRGGVANAVSTLLRGEEWERMRAKA